MLIRITTDRITDGIEPLDMVVTKFLFYGHFVINIYYEWTSIFHDLKQT